VASEGARRANLRQARGAYFPSITFAGQWRGFTQEIQNGEFLINNAERGSLGAIADCQRLNQISSGLTSPLSGFPQDCSGFTLSDAGRETILASNNVFPFNFNEQPFQAQLSVNFPLFNGFGRERAASQAANAYEDAVHFRRGEELRLRTEVTSALDALGTAYNVVQVEERNRVVAGEQLELARARYSLGADNFLVLLDAERTMADAERAYLDGLYTFHVQLANLENAVGQRLRPEA
jgi:outer membrane protein TolC